MVTKNKTGSAQAGLPARTVIQRYNIHEQTAKVLKIHALATGKTAEEIVNDAICFYLSEHKDERNL
jgi:hypothetical protein